MLSNVSHGTGYKWFLKPYSTLLITSYCTLRREIASAHWRGDSVSAERVGQGEVSGVTRRALCTWQLLGLA